jgi:antitoxin ParD1/3/4
VSGLQIKHLTIFAKMLCFYLDKDIAMVTMNVSLPEPMKNWVEQQSETGKFSNASDYVRNLIRKDQEYSTKHKELQRLITEGVESGMCDLSIDEIMLEARQAKLETTNFSAPK